MTPPWCCCKVVRAISIGNGMNLLVHFGIYEYGSCKFEIFQNIPKCTSKFIRFFIYYNIQQNYSVADSSSSSSSWSCSYSFSFFLSIAHVCQSFNQVWVALNVLLFFAFSQVAQRCFGRQSKPTVRHLFSFGVQIWHFPVFPWQLPYCTV